VGDGAGAGADVTVLPPPPFVDPSFSPPATAIEATETEHTSTTRPLRAPVKAILFMRRPPVRVREQDVRSA
jgi:hypothetical protein